MKIKLKEATIKIWRDLLPIDFRVGLNTGLIHRQELTRSEVGRVFKSHGQKLKLFDDARALLRRASEKGYLSKKDQKEIVKINSILKSLEFKAQAAWGFDANEDHHNWWMDLPGCRCPKMDNRERQGVPGYIHNQDCPWHGWDQKEI